MLSKALIINELVLNRWATIVYGLLFVLVSLIPALADVRTDYGPGGQLGFWMGTYAFYGLLVVILIGANRFAKEFEEETITYLLTRKVNRKTIYLSFFAAGVIEIIIISMVGNLIFSLLSSFEGGFNLISIWFWLLPAFIFVYSLILIISLLAKNTTKTVIITLFVFYLAVFFTTLHFDLSFSEFWLRLTTVETFEDMIFKFVLIFLTLILLFLGTKILEKLEF